MFARTSSLWVLLILLSLTGCSGALFYPQSGWVRTPAELGIEYADVTITAPDGTELSAWWLESVGAPKGTVLFFHGNAENISTHLGSVYWLPERGYQVLMLDYRGYGRSEGVASFPAVLSDVNAAMDWLATDSRAADTPRFLFGQSLGAALGGYVAANRENLADEFSAVVLDAGFASYGGIAKEVASRHWLTWLFQYPAAWSMPNGYDLVDAVPAISPVPLLIIHSRTDSVIPYRDGEAIFAAAAEPKAFLTFEGDHVATFNNLDNRELLLEFFERSISDAKENGWQSQPSSSAMSN